MQQNSLQNHTSSDNASEAMDKDKDSGIADEEDFDSIVEDVKPQLRAEALKQL